MKIQFTAILVVLGLVSCSQSANRRASVKASAASEVKANATADMTANMAAEGAAEGEADADADGDMDSTPERGMLDILIVAKVPYQYAKVSGNYNPTHRAKNERHAAAVVKFLRALPAKVASYDYQIALMRDTCIYPVITSNSQPEPASAIENTFWQLDSGTEGPGRNVPGGTGAYDLLDNVITGLTDLHTTQVSYRQMPTAGTEETDLGGSTFTYGHVRAGVVSMSTERGPFVQYRRLADGLIVLDYLDGEDNATCDRPWLRDNAKLVIVAIDVQPSHYKGFRLCADNTICTMPDIETTLRDIGKLSGTGSTLQRHYQLYGITDKKGYLYENPYRWRSQRATLAEITPLLLSRVELETTRWGDSRKYETFRQLFRLRVDWQDFENYMISGSDQKLVNYLGHLESKEDQNQILDGIAAFAAQR